VVTEELTGTDSTAAQVDASSSEASATGRDMGTFTDSDTE